MTFTQWLESTLTDKFTPRKAVRYARIEHDLSRDATPFLLDLATEKIEQQGRLLTTDEVEMLIQRARVQFMHTKRLDTLRTMQPKPSEEDLSTIYPRALDFYNRLENQLQIIKSTLVPSWSVQESRSMRNMKLKTAHQNILSITNEMTKLARAKSGRSQEFDRIMKLEIVRWTELAKLLQARVTGQTSGTALRDTVTTLEKNFYEAKKEIEEKSKT